MLEGSKDLGVTGRTVSRHGRESFQECRVPGIKQSADTRVSKVASEFAEVNGDVAAHDVRARLEARSKIRIRSG